MSSRPWLKYPPPAFDDTPTDTRAGLRGAARFKPLDGNSEPSRSSAPSTDSSSWNAPPNGHENPASGPAAGPADLADWGIPTKVRAKRENASPELGWGSVSPVQSPKHVSGGWSPEQKVEKPRHDDCGWSSAERMKMPEVSASRSSPKQTPSTSKESASGWSPEQEPIQADSLPSSSSEPVAVAPVPTQRTNESWRRDFDHDTEKRATNSFVGSSAPRAAHAERASIEISAKNEWETSPETKPSTSPNEGGRGDVRGRATKQTESFTPAYKRRPESLERGWGNVSPEHKASNGFEPASTNMNSDDPGGWRNGSAHSSAVDISRSRNPFDVSNGYSNDNEWNTNRNGASTSDWWQSDRRRTSSVTSDDRVNNSARRFASSGRTRQSNGDAQPESDNWRHRSSSLEDQLVDPYENRPDYEKLDRLQTLFEQRQADALAKRRQNLQRKVDAITAQPNHPVFKVLKDRRLVSKLFSALLAVEPDENLLLVRLCGISKAFHAALSPILYSGVELSSNVACDRLFDSLSQYERGPQLMDKMRSLRLVNVEVRNAARLFLILGHQLADVQLAVYDEEEAPEAERARQRGRLVEGLSKCKRMERFAVRQNVIKPTQMAMLLALWPRLHHFDFQGDLPTIGEVGIKQALLPRLKSIRLYSEDGESESFLRYFVSPLVELELHGECSMVGQEWHYKRLRRLVISAAGKIRPAEVVEVLQKGRLPALRELIIDEGGLARWRRNESLEPLLSECNRRGISVPS